MSNPPIHQCECPHPDCTAMLSINRATPAGVYFCDCKAIHIRLGWSTGIDFVRSPYLTQEPKESEAHP